MHPVWIALIILLLIVLVLVTAVAVSALLRGWLPARRGRRVLVHQPDTTVEGLLATVARDGLVLRAARHVPEHGEPVALAGEVWVPRRAVQLVQVLDR